jgi:putative ATPase
MKHEGYGHGYQYAHDEPDKVADMECLPPSLAGREYYQPTDEGFEKRLRARMEEIRGIKSRRAPDAAKP